MAAEAKLPARIPSSLHELSNWQAQERWRVPSSAKGVTTRAKARTAKRPEVHGPSYEGEEIVCSARRLAAARKGGLGSSEPRRTHGLENNLVITRNVNRQYDDSFAVEGAKIGSTLRIRLPDRALVTDLSLIHI